MRSSDGVQLPAGSGTANEPQGSKDRYDAPGPGPGLLRSRGTSGLFFPPPAPCAAASAAVAAVAPRSFTLSLALPKQQG